MSVQDVDDLINNIKLASLQPNFKNTKKILINKSNKIFRNNPKLAKIIQNDIESLSDDFNPNL